MVKDDEKVSLENKLLSNEAFLKLDKLLNRFNIFQATDMGWREVKHTKFLSYLLNPNESHGLGDFFLKNFMTRLTDKCENFPNILNLDFAFAQVKAELNLKPKQLDCFISVPLRKETNYWYFAIENKIRSGQGKQQLNHYSVELEKLGYKNIIKFYLTFNYDDSPKDTSWIHITYEEIVLPTVKTTIDLLDETGSTYLKSALQDYYDLMYMDSEIDDEIDNLARAITSDQQLDRYIKEISSVDENQIDKISQIKIKHPKTIEFLKNYEKDLRSNVLKNWTALSSKVNKYKFTDDLIFVAESSTRSWLRFSILTDSNRRNLINLSDKSRKWLNSKCPIAYEVIVRKDKTKNTFQCQLVLTLGPLNSFEIRQSLLNALGKKSSSEFWTRLANLSKVENTDNPNNWLESKILKEEKLSPLILESVNKINSALEKYYQNIEQ